MQYKISYTQPHKHFIDIEIKIDNINSEKTYIQIPAWRPGRYELQNYARNIQKFEVFKQNGEAANSHKINRDRWEVDTNGSSSIIVKYNCYCYQMDAGGAWLDENQLYLNLIYCLFYVVGRENESCTLLLDIPDNYKIACGLPKNGKTLYANSYFQLMDSPLIASPNLIELPYKVNGIPFHIWIEGEVKSEFSTLVSDFEKFTQECINLFGDFPEKDYHFLFEILHNRYHHGVEHSNSTIIVLGPAENFNNPAFYDNLLGISCHELFHAWNALKIRPKEMVPYDLTQENYFRTGYVIEGLTTYYGDYLLARSGAFNIEQYFKEVNALFQKHFENFGRFNMSVADSSYDLWIDGYTQGIPNRKVSIYHKGAVAGMILDLEIRRITKNEKCLDDVMRLLWKNFGKSGIGYSEKHYQDAVESITGRSMEEYFSHCIYGLDPLEDRLNNALQYIGCELNITPSNNNSEKLFGFQTNKRDHRIFVDGIEPGSPADKFLTKDDEIIAINDEKVEGNLDQLIDHQTSIKISFIRTGRIEVRTLEADGNSYLPKYSIKKRDEASDIEKSNFNKWLNINF